MYFKAIRGAITVEKDDPVEIREASLELLSRIIEENKLEEKELISIIFSVTRDITSFNPATAVRLSGYKEVALFCVQEAFIRGQMDHTIRVLVHAQRKTNDEMRHIYLKKAKKLRPDRVIKYDSNVG